MNPSPPNRPAPKRLVKATPTSISAVAQRNESLWHSQTAPAASESSLIFPG
jgi:hypothetical protein